MEKGLSEGKRVRASREGKLWEGKYMEETNAR